MRTRFLLAVGATVLATGCKQDKTFTRIDDENPVVSPGQISGRVCDASGKTWLQDATVYTHVKEGERVIETRIAYTDRDGYFLLEELPGEREYDVLIQFGDESLTEQQKTGLWLGDGEDKVLDEPDCFDPLTIDVAIITGSYDSFELVLSNMGFANYTEVDGLDRGEVEGFLTDLTAMQSYDIIFFNGGHVEEYVIYEPVEEDEDEPGLGDGGEEGDTGTIPVSEEIMDNIRAYVEGGGSIYASDWAYDVVEQAYPDRLDFVGDDSVPDSAQLGEYDLVSAAVSDSSMAGWLGEDYIDVEYDLPVWPPIETATDSVSVHLRGDVTYRQGTVTRNIPTAPLLVSFGAGEGKVVYSTFRVAKNANSDVLQVLQYMMYNL